MSLKALLTALAKLPVADLRKVEARTKALLGMGAGGDPHTAIRSIRGSADDADWLTAGIEHELKRRGMLPAGVKLMRYAPSGYRTSSKDMRTLLLSRIGHQLTDPEKFALGRLAGKALYEHIAHKVPPSHSVLLRSLLQVPAALEWSYPGFMASGMLGMLVRRQRAE